VKTQFWRGKRVFLTGHTGFKGAWLAFLLSELGADVHGLALAPPATSLFNDLNLKSRLRHTIGDIRDRALLSQTLSKFEPQIILHLAAQALVSQSYSDPVGTYGTNVMGTMHVLDAISATPSVRAAVIVTSDKCYENLGQRKRFVESDPLGGKDIYSSSKACAEILTHSYRESFLSDAKCCVASVRAGNVIGGGDWSDNRIIPDIVRAAQKRQALVLRRPRAIWPWQHVLDPIRGYLQLAEALFSQNRQAAAAWNFGPGPEGEIQVLRIVERAKEYFPELMWRIEAPPFEEANLLAIDSTKAKICLKWSPLLTTVEAVDWTFSWYRDYLAGQAAEKLTGNHIEKFFARQQLAVQS